MIRQSKIGLLIVVVAVVLIIALAGRRTQSSEGEFRFDAAKLKDTAVWTRVNTDPYHISTAVDTLCRAPTTTDYEPERKLNPHAATYITVYVNNIGREAMRNAKRRIAAANPVAQIKTVARISVDTRSANAMSRESL